MKKIVVFFGLIFSLAVFASEKIGVGIVGIDPPFSTLSNDGNQVGLTSIDPLDEFDCGYCPPSSGTGNQDPTIVRGRILVSIRPYSECSSLFWVRNMIRYLRTGNYLYSDGPLGLNFVAYIMPEDLAITSFPYYRGWKITSQAGCVERGTVVSGAIALESHTVFDPTELWAEWEAEGTFRGSQMGFDTFNEGRVGVWWGPDGKKGTPDDVEYRSGPSRWVNEYYYVGVWGGSTDSVQTLINRYANECKFVTFRYSLADRYHNVRKIRFDQAVRVPINYTFPGWVEIAKSDFTGWALVGVDPGGFSGFLYRSTDLKEWELVSLEPFPSGWYYVKESVGSTGAFYKLRPDPYW